VVDQHQPIARPQRRVRLRSTMSTTIVSGSWRETRASSTHDSCHQRGAQRVQVDQRHRPVLLAEHALVDLELVHPLDPANLDPLDLVAGVGRGVGQLAAGERGQPGSAGDAHARHGAREDQHEERSCAAAPR
jgi:hypothetical protein